MKKLNLLLLVLLFVALSACVNASDIDVGSTARSAALGGAGLALGDEFSSTAVVNPAAPAVRGDKFRFVYPGLGFHSKGASFGDILDSIDSLSSGSDSAAIDLIDQFGKNKTTLAVDLTTGFAGQFGVGISAEAKGVIRPGTAVREWVTASQGFSNGSVTLSNISGIKNTNFQNTITQANAGNTAAARTSFDAYLVDLSDNSVTTSLAYGPSVTMSSGVKIKSGKLWVGTNLKVLITESRTWKVTGRADPNNPLSKNGSDITAGILYDAVEQPKSEETSLKGDVGAIYKPEKSIFQYGIVVNNVIKPKLKGISSAEGDTMISLGVAAKPISGLTVAADLVNVTRSSSESRDLRLGAEWRFGKLFAARAGLAGDKFTYGFGLFGVNVAFSNDKPGFLAHVLNF